MLFLATLTAMLFRPLRTSSSTTLDRIAFGLLVFVVLVRILLLHQPLRISSK